MPWGRGETALGYSLSWLGFLVFAPAAGWLSDRCGARAVVVLGGALLGSALALTGQARSLAEYYACFGLLGAAGTAGVLIPSTTIVTRWFVRGRGTAMGILSAGGPGSAIAFCSLNAWLIAELGWRRAFVAFGGIVAASSTGLALLYRDAPVAERGPSRSAGANGTRLALRARGLAPESGRSGERSRARSSGPRSS